MDRGPSAETFCEESAGFGLASPLEETDGAGHHLRVGHPAAAALQQIESGEGQAVEIGGTTREGEGLSAWVVHEVDEARVGESGELSEPQVGGLPILAANQVEEIARGSSAR